MSVRTPGTHVIRLERDRRSIPLAHSCQPIPIVSRLFRTPLQLRAASQFAIVTQSALAGVRLAMRGGPGDFAITGAAGMSKSAKASNSGAFTLSASASAVRRLSASAGSAFVINGAAALQHISYEPFVPADEADALTDVDGEVFMSLIDSEGTQHGI